MPKASKKELQSLYQDHKVQRLISKFISSKLEALNPIFDSKRGLSYPLVEDVVGDKSNTEKFLEKLYESGVLNRKLYDKIIHCPSCSSANVSIHYTCPYCKSFDIMKSALIEHIKCGYIDTEDHFQKEGKLVCPKCNKELSNPDIDYNRAGVWCSCNKCTKKFDIPVPSHFCRECEAQFSFEDASFRDLYAYSLSPEAKKEETIGWIMIASIIDFLKDLGFIVESPGFLDGKSGTSHMFDITAISDKTKNTTVIDLSTSDDAVSEQSVISMFAKIFDTDPEKACIIAIPKMNENGRKLASLYKIKLIEAKDQKVIIEALKEWVKK
jgi:transcription elongation factor Elf1